MVTKFIQILHQIQYRLPGFFTLALWGMMFIAFIIGNSPFGLALLFFLITKIIVQLSFWAILIKKMNRLMEAEGDNTLMENIRAEIKAFIRHTKIVIDEADFRRRLAERYDTDEEEVQLVGNRDKTLGDLGSKEGGELIDFEDVLINDDEFSCYANLQIGDCVKVEEGVQDPNFPEFCLTGYRGRILEFIPTQIKTHPLILIEWDSFSLKKIPQQQLQLYIKAGLDYTQIQLDIDKIARTSPRDTLKEVEKTKRNLWYKMESNK